MDNLTLCKAGGLILELTFDDVSGTTIYDTSGCGNHATAVNAVTYMPGTTGNCAKGDGRSARIDIPSAKFDLANKTVTGFFKFEQTASTNFLLCADSTTSFTHGLYTVSASAGIIKIAPKGGNKFREYTDLLADYNFYVLRHTGNACKVRRNAEADMQLTGNSTSSTDPSFPIRLFSARGGSSQYSSGTIDQFRIYNRELTDHEVDTLYNGGQGC